MIHPQGNVCTTFILAWFAVKVSYRGVNCDQGKYRSRDYVILEIISVRAQACVNKKIMTTKNAGREFLR